MIDNVLPGVHQIDLNFVGQPGTIAAYLLTAPAGDNGDAGAAALIETGPTSTQGALLEGLRAAGVDPARVTDVVVTHIHLDHSGGAGTLLREALPGARLWVHPVGLPHLVDPEKLLRSATRLYGAMMDTLWGEVLAVPAERVTALTDGARMHLAGHDVEILFTPGHAAHHVALRHLPTGAVFTGDVAGVRVAGADVINPPTVPPEFDLAAWERSIDRLITADPSALLIAHFGIYRDAQAHLRRLRHRLRDWVGLIRAGMAEGRGADELAAALRERDAATPGAEAEGLRRLDLIAGYGIGVAGITRYLEKQARDA